jgi:hypothetical protein
MLVPSKRFLDGNRSGQELGQLSSYAYIIYTIRCVSFRPS